METIEKNIIEELKEKLAGYLFNRQNHSGGIGTDEFYVQAYLDQIWQYMNLDHKQKQCVETAYREMIFDGYLDLEAAPSTEQEVEPSADWKQESESRINLTDDGIAYYIYSYV